METLFRKSLKKIQGTSLSFKRYLYSQIDWSDRLIFIQGARGAGKTTLLLQHILESAGVSEEALYVSLDDIWFSDHRLTSLADDFSNLGGKFLYLDEVHKYPDWSREIKNIYDDHPELNVIVTGSSALQIYRQQADLSRRAIIYDLRELSLREYISLRYRQDYPVFTMDDILSNHVEISLTLLEKIKPVKFFKEYSYIGQYPYFMENPDNYLQRLQNTVNIILESDLPAILNIDYSSVIKLKKLLYIIATSVPFKPNVTELSSRTGIARDTLLRYLHHLGEARLITLLRNNQHGNSILAKPEKIYLHNSNLMAAFSDDNLNIGTMRETFFLNQVSASGTLHYSGSADFIYNDKVHFEIGGKTKSQKQLRGLSEAYIAADDIEIGHQNKIPLWLFGFLY